MQNNNLYQKKRVCVVGGGAAGMMAAGTALKCGADVTIYEHTGRLGKKLAITGKGRCNVTNASSVEKLLENVTKNARFLYAAFNAFTPEDTIIFFEDLGVPLKTERGMRVFPLSDKAADIVNALKTYTDGCNKIYQSVKGIFLNSDGSFTVVADDSNVYDSVIIATGGKSYPLTGSDGSGYRLAKKLGHTVTELKPSLIPIESDSPLCRQMQGLSLKNVKIRVRGENGESMYEDFGEMLFTHFGVSGPVILSASAHVKDCDISKLTLEIDLKPALDENELDKRILSDFNKYSNRDFINSLNDLLPSKMIEPFVTLTGISPRKKVNEITKEERRGILTALKRFPIPLKKLRPIEEAIVTSGGVNVKEINPKTMQSKIVESLYFAGEILDVDAYTGGFNLQIAFSTAFLAGKSAAEL